MERVRTLGGLMLRGVRNPTAILAYVRQRDPVIKRKHGQVTWNSFEWGGGDDPAERHAMTYVSTQQMQAMLPREQYDRALEFGCGWGRITPWFSAVADELHGIDVNEEMLQTVRPYYDQLQFVHGVGQDLPYKSNAFDLVFSRSVLQHIGDADFRRALGELERVAAPDGHILLCEATELDERSPTFVNRDVAEYEDSFAEFTVVDRQLLDHPAWRTENSILLFEAE